MNRPEETYLALTESEDEYNDEESQMEDIEQQ